MVLAVVRDLRDVRPPATAEEAEQFETDVLAGLVLARPRRGSLAARRSNGSVAAATTPAARLILTLAAVHAARVAQIATLVLDDVDLGNRGHGQGSVVVNPIPPVAIGSTHP
ncbi:hypothetical protein ACH3WN_15565 [Streptomyces albogriseolus]|uniref:hypothetical protein n=1 Tax=Streptomyces albogriseolus TaxID=1887 RepID=UPI0037955B8B